MRVINCQDVIDWAKGIVKERGTEFFYDAANTPLVAEELMKMISLYEPFSTGNLKYFSIVARNEGTEHEYFDLESPDSSATKNAIALAGDAWFFSGGSVNPTRAREVIAAYRTEYARMVLYEIAAFAYLYPDANKKVIADLEAVLNVRNWLSADDVSIFPFIPCDIDITAGNQFWNWLDTNSGNSDLSHLNSRSPVSKIEPAVTRSELLYAMALSWLDEAHFDTGRGMELMVDAAGAFDCAGKALTMQMQMLEVSKNAKRMSDIYHQKNRAKREEARRKYLTGNFPSKDSAAESLAKEAGVTWRTMREWLKGA